MHKSQNVLNYLPKGAQAERTQARCQGESQKLGYAMRGARSFGIHYLCVRTKGECYGVMRPRVLSDAIHWRYLRYHYDQGAIVDVESLDGGPGR